MDLQKAKDEINVNKRYKPREIAKNGWLDYCYHSILKLIHKNELKAKDFGLGETPYYRVKGSEILRYIKENQ